MEQEFSDLPEGSFVEMHGVTLPFTLGIVYESSHGDQPMNVTWRLQHPVPDDLFADPIR